MLWPLALVFPLPSKKKKLKKLYRTGTKFLNRLSLYAGKIPASAIPDLAIMGGLAWLGFSKFKSPGGALFGPISYKLALAPGGTPPVAQMTGVAGLTALGLSLAYKPDEAPGWAPGAPPAPIIPKDTWTLYIDEEGKEWCLPTYVAFDPKKGCKHPYEPQLTLQGWRCILKGPKCPGPGGVG